MGQEQREEAGQAQTQVQGPEAPIAALQTMDHSTSVSARRRWAAGAVLQAVLTLATIM